MKPFQELLEKLRACEEAREWAGDMAIEEVVKKCHRGDWLLWLAKKVNVDDRKLTLAKGLCANTVRHLMKDESCIKAVDAAIAYGKGEIELEELNAATVYTYANTYTAADYAAAYAAYDAAYAANAAAASATYAADATAAYADDATAAYTAYSAAYAARADAYSARKANQMQTANICREVIGQEVVERVNELLK